MPHQSFLVCWIATYSALSLLMQGSALKVTTQSELIAPSAWIEQPPITLQNIVAAAPGTATQGVGAQATPTAMLAGPAAQVSVPAAGAAVESHVAAAEAASPAAQSAAAAAPLAAKSDAAALPSAVVQLTTAAHSPLALHVVPPVVQNLTHVGTGAQLQALSAALPQATGMQIASEVPLVVSDTDSQHVPEQFTAPSLFWSSSQWTLLRLSSMIAAVTFAMLVKAMCIAGNVMVHLSPFPQAMRWKCRRSTGEADAAPYVSIAFGGSQWCFYGIFAWYVTAKTGFLILVYSNCLGAVLGTYYTMTFYKNCRNEIYLDSLRKYLSAVTVLVCLQVSVVSVLPAERALFVAGLVSSFCSFLGACSVLVTIPQVLRLQDSRSIPGPYAVACVCSAMLWSLCGWLLEDPVVLLPSLFSMGCSTAALACKVMYPSMELTEKQSLNVLFSVEEGVALMGRSIVGKVSKSDLSAMRMEF